MAMRQASGEVRRNCQHANIQFDATVVETGTHETGRLELKDFYCPDCEQHFVVALKDGFFAKSAIPLVEKSLADEQIKARAKPAATAAKPSQETPAKKPEIEDGPGKELMLVFAGLGVPTCQGCRDLAHKMNSEGIEWCEANVDAIAADILPRAQEWLSRPDGGWTEKLKARAPQFAKEAVLKRYVGIALRNWRDKLSIDTEE